MYWEMGFKYQMGRFIFSKMIRPQTTGNPGKKGITKRALQRAEKMNTVSKKIIFLQKSLSFSWEHQLLSQAKLQ